MKKPDKTLHFIAGLPRAGSTLLTSLLAQNPRIAGMPISGLCGIFNGIYANWDKDGFHQESPNPKAKKAVLAALLSSYHSHITKPIIIDKNRQWIFNIALLEEVLGRRVKVILPVRPIIEVLASFENIRLSHPLELTGADEAVGQGGSSVLSRAQYFMAPNGVVGMAFNSMKDAVVAGYLDRLLFVDYNKLVSNHDDELKRIYAFLEEEPFEKHDFSNITRPDKSNWLVHRFPGLHDIRPELKKTSRDPKIVLGEEVCAQFNQPDPWEQWT